MRVIRRRVENNSELSATVAQIMKDDSISDDDIINVQMIMLPRPPRMIGPQKWMLVLFVRE